MTEAESLGLNISDVKLDLVNSVAKADEFLRWLGERRSALAIDTETGGLEWWHQKLRLVQFGDTTTGWAIPWERWGGVAVEALKRYDQPLVFHHAKFDIHFLEEAAPGEISIPWANVNDTAVAAHLLDPRRARALKTLATHYVHPSAAAGQQILNQAVAAQKWNWATIPIDFEPYWTYGALDTVLTANLHDVFLDQSKQRPAYKTVYDLEIAVLEALYHAEKRGCCIDRGYAAQRLDELQKYVLDTRTWVETTYGVNPGSNAAVATRLQQDGVELTELTASGAAFKMDEDVLEGVHHPLAEAVLRARKAQKVANTYLQNFMDITDGGGLVHPDINSLGARTGRMSITRPALPTLPRADEHNALAIIVRDCFVPRSETNSLLLIDYDQIEARLLAHFADDPALIEAILEGDIHTATARRIYQDNTITRKDPRRQLAKNAQFAILYGAGPRRFAQTAGIPEEQGAEFMGLYHAAFPGVRQLQRLIEVTANHNAATDGYPWIESPLGRRHPLDPDKMYTGTNYLIQGTAADVFKQKLVELANAGLDEFMCLPIHDEVMFDVPDDQAVEVERLAIQVMEDTTSWKVPLTCAADIVKRWGDKYR